MVSTILTADLSVDTLGMDSLTLKAYMRGLDSTSVILGCCVSSYSSTSVKSLEPLYEGVKSTLDNICPGDTLLRLDGLSLILSIEFLFTTSSTRETSSDFFLLEKMTRLSCDSLCKFLVLMPDFMAECLNTLFWVWTTSCIFHSRRFSFEFCTDFLSRASFM